MTNRKTVNVALQGGGAHGAYAWGVLDKLIEDGRVEIDGLTATSAGSMNAAVYAYGKMTGGADGARETLERFWHNIAKAGALFSPVRALPFETLLNGPGMDGSLMFQWFTAATHMLSPYDVNPFDFNPLREVLESTIDVEALTACKCAKLFISCTNVHTGRMRVFVNEEIDTDVIMASACLPYLFKAVEIDGAHYWDGGYTGNPALYPLIYHTDCRDILILNINPIVRAETPKTAHEIHNRINEISFNSSLLQELRAIAFAARLLDEDWLKPDHRPRLKRMLVHAIRADRYLKGLSVASKFNTDWDFLCYLRDLGRDAAAEWLADHFDDLGVCDSIDFYREFLNADHDS